MNYKLAKQLKDAGFPQTSDEIIRTNCKHRTNDPAVDMIAFTDCNHWAVIPTLSELIEACEDKFEALIKQVGGWVAISNMEGYMMKQDFEAVETPLIAVAKVYLKLNK